MASLKSVSYSKPARGLLQRKLGLGWWLAHRTCTRITPESSASQPHLHGSGDSQEVEHILFHCQDCSSSSRGICML